MRPHPPTRDLPRLATTRRANANSRPRAELRAPGSSLSGSSLPSLALLGMSLLALAPAMRAQAPAAPQPGLLSPYAAAAPGFERTVLATMPPYAAWAALPDGTRLVHDGTRLVRTDGDWLAEVANFGSFVFPSFIASDGRTAWVGESSGGTIRAVDLERGTQAVLATIPYNYDALLLDGRRLLVSAAPCGFNCGTQLIQLDTQGGAQLVRANLPGPSGPVCLDRDGNLWYGRNSPSYPAPPASASLLRFDAALLDAPAPFGLADAQVVQGQLDSVSDLVVDLDGGVVLLSQSRLGAESEVVCLDLAGGLIGRVARGTPWFSGLALVDRDGPGAVRPYSRAGASLVLVESEFVHGGPDRLVEYAPKRAATSVVGAGGPGPVTWRLSDGPPRGGWILLAAPRQAWSGAESNWMFGGAPFLSAVAPAGWTRFGKGALDAQGRGDMTWSSNGSSHVLQAILLGADGRAVGTSAATFD
ncbi:MAG: hypothetical protein RIR65_1976 [Planctomycetota bacterium]